jgi:hypothetical protein
MQCDPGATNQCLLKLTHDHANTDDSGTCYGTVGVACGFTLEFYYGPSGQYEYAVTASNRRSRSRSMEEEGTALPDAHVVSSPLEEDAVAGSSSSSSSLSLRGGRGGAKGSMKFL